MNWTLIEKLGNSKIARSSYYWFFIIPIAAKLLQNIPKKINLNLLSIEPIEINLSFPFTWYLIFIAGGLFIISNLIYQTACPHIIREFKNFSEFLAAGYPNSYLIDQGNHHEFDQEELDDLKNATPEMQIRLSRRNNPRDFELEYNLRAAQKNLFDKIYNKANNSKKQIRYLATVVIVAAIVLFAIIVLQNIVSVFEIYQESKK